MQKVLASLVFVFVWLLVASPCQAQLTQPTDYTLSGNVLKDTDWAPDVGTRLTVAVHFTYAGYDCYSYMDTATTDLNGSYTVTWHGASGDTLIAASVTAVPGFRIIQHGGYVVANGDQGTDVELSLTTITLLPGGDG